MRQTHKTILIWTILALMFASVYTMFRDTSGTQKDLDVTAYKALLADTAKAQDIATVNVEPLGQDTARYVVSYKNKSEKSIIHGEYAAQGGAGTLMQAMRDANVPHQVKTRQESSFWPQLLMTILPIVLIAGVFIFFLRQLQSGGGKAMSFGKAKARLLTDHQNRVTFKDVAGVEEAKDEVEEIIAFLKDPKKFTRLGGRIPKGVLMMGSPGTGKTLLARAIAGEAGVPFFSISGSDFVEMFVGVGASRVRDLFEQGKKNAPCIIFIDEIDAVGRHRGAGLGGGHDEREQTLNQLLVEMDGFESNDGVIIIAATNRPDVLDPALLRPGRFDRRIVVPRPDLRGRAGILAVHTRKVPLGTGVDLEVIARGTPGFSGADLEFLVNEAALIAARRDKEKVEMVDFEDAKDKVLMGTERRSMIISEKEKRNTAVHEAGHALVARFIGDFADPVHKVTIIPRGRALGVTQQLPPEDRLSMTAEFVKGQIAILMGGRVAEEIVFGQLTTGAGNDIERATELARAMVTEWGMSEEFGPLNFTGGKTEVFLGRDFSNGGERHSEETSRRIDAEIRRIVMEQYHRARAILTEHRAFLDAVASALLEFETIDGDDIGKLIAGEKIDRPAPVVAKPATVAATTANSDDDAKNRPGLMTPTPEPA